MDEEITAREGPDVPFGWRLEPGPEGTFWLTPSPEDLRDDTGDGPRARRLDGGGALLCAFVLGRLADYSWRGGLLPHVPLPPEVVAVAATLAAVACGIDGLRTLAEALARVCWRVGPDRLELWRFLWGAQWATRFTDATLEVSFQRWRPWRWPSRPEGYLLRVVHGPLLRQRHVLLFDEREYPPARAGRLLAQLTGWRLDEEPDG